MAAEIYPAIGWYLSPRESQRVLDVGAQWYTRNNKLLFKNPGVSYTVADKAAAPRDLVVDTYLRSTLQALPGRRPELKRHFDIIISFGVLGYYPMSPKEVRDYFLAVGELLKDDGYFFLKFDLTP
jgi:hypothetical protein